MLKYIKCELSLILIRRVDVQQYISEMTHILNALRFWLKAWCQVTCMVALSSMYVSNSVRCPSRSNNGIRARFNLMVDR
jgi:hypothetical protein